MIRSLTRFLLLFLASVFFLLLLAGCTNNTVYVFDHAKVLNQNQIINEGKTLPYPIAIYTTTNYHGTKDGFVIDSAARLNNSHLIIFADDVLHGYLAIVAGSDVHLTNTIAKQAQKAFIDNFNLNHNHTNATIATLESLKTNLSAGIQIPIWVFWFALAIFLSLVLILIIRINRNQNNSADGQKQVHVLPNNQDDFEQKGNTSFGNEKPDK